MHLSSASLCVKPKQSKGFQGFIGSETDAVEVKEMEMEKAAPNSFKSKAFPKMPSPISLRPRRSRRRSKLDADLHSLDCILHVAHAATSNKLLSPFPANLGLPDLSSEDEESSRPKQREPTPYRSEEIDSSSSSKKVSQSQVFQSPLGPDEEMRLAVAQDCHDQSSKRSRDSAPRRLLFFDSSTAKTNVPRPKPQRAEGCKSDESKPASTSQSLHFSPSSAFAAKRRKTTAA